MPDENIEHMNTPSLDHAAHVNSRTELGITRESIVWLGIESITRPTNHSIESKHLQTAKESAYVTFTIRVSVKL